MRLMGSVVRDDLGVLNFEFSKHSDNSYLYREICDLNNDS